MRRLQFGLRSTFLLVLLVATFFAGWNAHRYWPKRKLEQTVLDKIGDHPNAADEMTQALREGKQVSVDYSVDTDTMLLKIEDKNRTSDALAR